MLGVLRRDFGSGRWVEWRVAPNPGPLTLDGTRSYILGPAPCVIIDPGPDRPSHLDAIEVSLGANDAAAVCLTHYHPDHAAGAEELTLRLGAPLAATSETARLAGLEPPAIPLGSGSVIAFGGGELEVVPAPGHCADHVCFHWRDTRAVFVGDVMLGEGTSMIAPPEGDMAAYLATLERLEALRPAVIYPGHGPEITDAARRVADYLAHRREREAQIVSALAGGPADPAEIRARVYPDLDPRLHQAAEGSVRAHLSKLLAEGRVSVAGETYRLAAGG